MNGDWLKLHRKAQDSRVFSDPHAWWFFCKCLLRANWRTGYFKGREISVGQFAFSYRKLAEEMDVCPNTLRKNFKKLQSWGCITLENANKYTVATICNYSAYQSTVSRNDTVGDTDRDTMGDTVGDTDRDTDRAHDRRKNKNLKEGKEQQEGAAAESGSSDAGSEKSAEKSFAPEDVQLPYPSEEVRDLWLKWCASRKKLRKPITEGAAEQQVAFMESIGQERSIAALRHSIGGSYQGLFEPRARAGPRPKVPSGKFEGQADSIF